MAGRARQVPTLRSQAAVPLVLLILIGLAAAISIWFLPPYTTSQDVLVPPRWDHWLGTNDIGQDVLTGLLIATPNTVLIALTAGALALSLAVAVSLVAALSGGVVSGIVLRLVDILQVVPSILVLLLISAWSRPGLPELVVILALVTWHDDVRVLRAVFLRELTRENVHFARRMGASWRYCAARHILPGVWPTIAGLHVQNIRQAALRTAGLSFLGLADPRLLTFGGMMQNALDYLYGNAWLWLLPPPAFCLSFFLLSLLTLEQRFERRALLAKHA